MPTDLIKPAQVAPLAGPSQAERDRLLALPRVESEHAAALAGLACLQRVEAPVGPPALPLNFPLTVAAWNLERCYFVGPSAALLERQGASIALLGEVDNGMARTGQRHTTAELAAALSMSYAYGVEFLELELGAPVELQYCKDDFNRHGFHGNGLLAATPLLAPVMIRLDRHGHWFRPETKAHRIGTRCAIAGAVATEQGPLYVVSVHLENLGDAEYRRRQMETLLDAVDELAGDIPAIVGGDLNTGLADGGDFEKETLFALAQARGYARHGGPLTQMSTRPSMINRDPARAYKLDWFLTRRLDVAESHIVASVADDGTVLSDHDMIVATVSGLRR